jgi:DNA-directed RNA polymerase subunit F
MNLDPAPRVSKTVFLLIDAGLLVTAFIIAYLVKDPFAPLPFVLTVLCVALAGIVGLIPFLLDYAADSAEYVQAERTKVAEHVQRLNAASESLARAAAQIKAVEEAVHKTAHAAENLPYRMQEKLAEFNQQLAATEDEEKERLTEELATLRQGESERLSAIADKIHKATGELSALEAATRKSLAAAQDSAVSKFESRLTAALSALDAKLATLTIPVVAAPAPAAPAPVVEKQPEPVPAAPSVVESISVTEAPAPVAVVEEPKPRKPRAPRKPKPEDTLAAMSEPMPGDTPAESSGEPAFSDSPAETASAPSEDSQAEAAATVEPSVSADGATRLLVTAYIGIGNKLYIRGDGPGLSWDKGVPMKFVSIGKWGWATDEATGPVACKLYKNDETVALSGEVFLEPGQHVEVTALF